MTSHKKIILIAAAFLAVGIVVGLILRQPNAEKIDVDRGGSSGDQLTVPQVNTQTLKEDNDRYSIAVDYPELQGMGAIGIQQKINADIKTSVYNQVAGFRSSNASITPTEDSEFKSSFDGNFTVALLSKSFFSVVLFYSDYSAGAAHPNNYLMTLNYDLRSGSSVTLDAFLKSFQPAAGYMDRLAGYVKDDLIRQIGDDPESVDAINSGAAATAENYERFTLTTEGLSIHFDPYQVAAYAAGTPEVKVGYDDLFSKVIKSAAGTGSSTPAAAPERWWLQ